MKDNSFKAYQIMTKDGPIPVTQERFQTEFSKEAIACSLRADNIFYRKPKPDTRSKLRKIYDDYRKRLSHAWYALKGYDCD
mgnify:CR=1 FL=1